MEHAEDVLNKASSKAHAVVDSVAGAADDVARKAKPAIDKVSTMAHQAVDKAADAAESLKARQTKLIDDTSGYIADNPMKAVAIAVVTGFVLSRFFR